MSFIYQFHIFHHIFFMAFFSKKNKYERFINFLKKNSAVLRYGSTRKSTEKKLCFLGFLKKRTLKKMYRSVFNPSFLAKSYD